MLTLPLEGLPPSLSQIDHGHCAVVWACAPKVATQLLFGITSNDRSAAPSVVVMGVGAMALLKPTHAMSSEDLARLAKWQVFEFSKFNPKTTSAFSLVREDLALAFPAPTDLVFVAMVEDLAHPSAGRLQEILKAFASTIHALGHSALLLLVGGDEKTTFEHHLRDCHHLDGLAALTAQQLHTYYWHSGQRFSGECVSNVRAFDARPGFEVFDTVGENMTADDVDVIWCAHAAMVAEQPALPTLTILPNNEAVYEKGQTASAATLIFSIDTPSDAKRVARWVYTLRETRGTNLKMSVVIASPRIRAFVMNILLASGANLVFEPTATPGYIRTMLSVLANERFTRAIPERFDVIDAHFEAMALRGRLEPEVFFQTIESNIAEAADKQTTHGALLLLTPNRAMTTEEAADAFHPGRSGDIGCVADNHVVVYLMGCTPQHLTLALKHAFTVPVDQLFMSYIDLYDDHDVLDTLAQLRGTLSRRPKQAKASLSSKVTKIDRTDSASIQATQSANKASEPIFVPTTPVRVSLNEVLK